MRDRTTRPVILEAAINGQTIKAVNHNVPRSSEELAEDAIRCLDAGASIVHTHIDDIFSPPEIAAELYLEHFLPVLRSHPNAILYPTLGFGDSAGARYAHAEILAGKCDLRMGFVDPGSVNLGGALADGSPDPIDFAYTNTPADIRYGFDFCDHHALGPSIAIFEPGFLRHTLAYHRAGHLPQGAMVKFYMGGEYGYMGPGHKGVSFGLPPRPWALDVYLRMMEGCELPWSVAVLGGDVFDHGLARHALTRGGHLRVGLEDHRGEDTPANAELVARADALCQEVGRAVADAHTAAEILDLPE